MKPLAEWETGEIWGTAVEMGMKGQMWDISKDRLWEWWLWTVTQKQKWCLRLEAAFK